MALAKNEVGQVLTQVLFNKKLFGGQEVQIFGVSRQVEQLEEQV
jgi:hypothetical protein